MKVAASLGLTLALWGCGAQSPAPVPPPAEPVTARSEPAEQASAATPTKLDPDPFTWMDSIYSPRPEAVVDPDVAELLPLCGEGDAAMNTVAKRLARRQAAGLGQLDMAELTFAMRTAGGPHVWPRAWTLEGPELAAADTRARFGRFLASFGDGGKRRCGMASLRPAASDQIIAAVAVDALADLSSVPTRARAGQWIDVQARLLVPASAAKIVVLGPRGAPRSIPTTLDGDRVKGRFAADHIGTWIVQVLATTVATGPRPVVEAMLFVDEEPPTAFRSRPAPGEAAAPGEGDDTDAVKRMVDAARRTERVATLRRDPRLDRLAQAHAEAMHRARVVGHDVGDGDPKHRVESAGIDFKATGENVARAKTLERAHRALWASPSHRGNLLLRRFEAIGVGVVRDDDGSVWVCEIFADY